MFRDMEESEKIESDSKEHFDTNEEDPVSADRNYLSSKEYVRLEGLVEFWGNFVILNKFCMPSPK